MSELDANVIVNGQKAIATVAQTGTVIEDGGAIDATSVIQTASGPQKVVKTYTVGGGGGGGGSATWGDISGTLSNQTDLQNALNDKVGIVQGELKLTDGDTIVVETEDDSKTEIFSDGVSIDATGNDATSEASLYINGTVGAVATVTDGSNTIDIKANSTDGATITKTENNVTKSVLWEGQGLENEATGTKSVCILTDTSYNSANYSLAIGSNSRSYNYSVSLGSASKCSADMGVALGNQAQSAGYGATALGANSAASGMYGVGIGAYSGGAGQNSIAIGYFASSNAQNAIQLGEGTNTVTKQFQVYSYPMLDGNTGKIPSDRMTKVIELTTTSVELASDNIYNGAELASVTFTLPATVPVNFTAQVNFTSGTTATVLTAPNTINFEGDDCTGGAFTPVASKRYQVLIASDGVNVNGYVIGR